MSLDEQEILMRQQEIEDDLKEQKMLEIQAKAKNRKVKKNESSTSMLGYASPKKSQEFDFKDPYKNQKGNPNNKSNFVQSKVNDEQAKDAVDYINSIIKRDNKPTNPERKIMTKLFDQMTQVKLKVPKLNHYQTFLKKQAQEIKDKVGPRGMMLENQVELCSKTALYNIDSAFKEIDYEEQINPNQKKLTSLQRNRMALSFMDMNEQPRKFQYYQRFIDMDSTENQEDSKNNRSKTIKIKSKKLNSKQKTSSEFRKTSQNFISQVDQSYLSLDGSIENEVQSFYQDNQTIENLKNFEEMSMHDIKLFDHKPKHQYTHSKLQTSMNFAFGFDNGKSALTSQTVFDNHLTTNTFLQQRQSNLTDAKYNTPGPKEQLNLTSQNFLPQLNDPLTYRSTDVDIKPQNMKFRYNQRHSKNLSSLTPGLQKLNQNSFNFQTLNSNNNLSFMSNNKDHRRRDQLLNTINNPNKYLQRSFEMLEKNAVDILSYHTQLRQKIQLHKNLNEKLDPIQNGNPELQSQNPTINLNLTKLSFKSKAKSTGVTPHKRTIIDLAKKKAFFPANVISEEDALEEFKNVNYKTLLEQVLKETDFMKTIMLKEKSRGIEGDPRFKVLDNAFEKINYFQYIHNLEKSQLAEISARLKELVILKNERRYNLAS
eukprot:403334774